MQVYVNGDSREVSDQTTLAQLIGELELPAKRIAVELNRLVVPRTEWEGTLLSDNDRIEVVHFVGGGNAFLIRCDRV